jgi:hypothetical protein
VRICESKIVKIFIISKWSFTVESEKFSSLNRSVLNGHTPITKIADFILSDVSAFGSDWLTTGGMP